MALFTEKATFEAVRWTGDNLAEVKAFLGAAYRDVEQDILAPRAAGDWPEGKQRTDGLLKPTGETKWLGIAYEVGQTLYHVKKGEWIVARPDDPAGFVRESDKDFRARYESLG